MAYITACGSALGNVNLKEAESFVSATNGSERKSYQSAKGTRQHIIDRSSTAVSSFKLEEIPRLFQEGLTNGTMKEGQWDA